MPVQVPSPPPANAATTGGDDSDSDAPETFTLTQSKKHSQQHNAAIQRVHAAQNEKKRLQNQQRDRRLKEQAENVKKKRRAEEMVEEVELQARMERAMQEAVDEEEDEDQSTDDDEEFMGIGGDSSGVDEDDVGDDMDEEEERDDDYEAFSEDESMETSPCVTPPSTRPRRNPKHLPDHLFTAAFSQAEKAKSYPKVTSKRNATDDGRSSRSTQKRAWSNAKPKDILIGCVSFQISPHILDTLFHLGIQFASNQDVVARPTSIWRWDDSFRQSPKVHQSNTRAERREPKSKRMGTEAW